MVSTTVLLLIALGLFLAAVGLFAAPYFSDLRRMAGYYPLREDILALTRYLQGEFFRDGDDVVVSGNIRGQRAYVRFSRRENAPAAILHLNAPATFNLSIVPKNSPNTEGGEKIRTGNDAIDARWNVRSEDANAAKLFLATGPAITEIKKLCGSGKTFLSVDSTGIELDELVLPDDGAADHLIGQFKSMTTIAGQLAAMPGGWMKKVEAVRPERPTRKILAFAMIAAGVVLVVISAAQYERARQFAAAASGYGGTAQGIPFEEESRIPNMDGWRLATSADFDPDLVNWMEKQHVKATGRVEGDFVGGSSIGTDHAYLLVNSAGARRLVVLVEKEVKLDRDFSSVALFAKVPKNDINSLKVSTGATPNGESDGLLVVRDKSDVHSGIVLSFHQGTPISMIPDDYRATRFN